jgi:hypothetical protein
VVGPHILCRVHAGGDAAYDDRHCSNQDLDVHSWPTRCGGAPVLCRALLFGDWVRFVQVMTRPRWMSAVPRLWPQWPPRNQCHLAAHCPRSCRRRPTRPVVAVFLLGRDSRSLVGTPVRLRDRSPAGGTGLPHRGSHACDRAGRMDPGEAQAGDVLADADRATAQWAPTAAARLSGSLGEDHFSALCGSV